jgi:hypothetical protein
MHFLTSPQFEVLGGGDLRDAFMGFGNDHASVAEPIECLQGRTQQEECSIFGLVEINRPGVLDVQSGEQLYAVRFRVWAAIVGLRLAGSTTREIDSSIFRFTDVQEWMPLAWGMDISESEIIYRLPRKALEVFCFSSLALRAEVRCELKAGSRNKTRLKTSITPIPLLRVTPTEPQSLEWFLELMPRFENFYSLFLGTSVAPREVGIIQGDSAGWLIKRQSRKRQKTNVQLWVRCPPEIIARSLANWLSVPEEERAIEKTVLGTLRKSSLFVETEFLSLAQAIEAFGRSRFNKPLIDSYSFKQGLKQVKESIRMAWTEPTIVERCSQLLNHANEGPFADRLQQSCGMLPSEFFKQCFGQQEEFIRSIVQTRNYFTHLGIKPGARVVQEGKNLFLLNQKLSALLRCLMMIDLGVPFEYLREPIAYQAKRWS